jgi:hypothetical protein
MNRPSIFFTGGRRPFLRGVYEIEEQVEKEKILDSGMCVEDGFGLLPLVGTPCSESSLLEF